MEVIRDAIKSCKKLLKFIIFIDIKLFQILGKGEDGWKGWDDELYLVAWDHVLAGIVYEVVGI